MIKSVMRRGVLYTIGIVINRIVPEKLFRFRVFQVFELEGQGGSRRSDDNQLTFRWCDNDDDFAAAKRLTFFETKDPDAATRYAACLAELRDAQGEREIVGGVWRGLEQFDEEDLGIRIQLADQQAWIFAAFVSKDHRGSGIYRRLLEHAIRSQEALVHFASINPYNKPSISAHRAFVKRTVGTCVAIRVFNFAFAFTKRDLRANRMFSSNAKSNPIEVFTCNDQD
jgi:GNAT superfamily N-acetyltransferase